jgi:hypothetical protein
MALKQRGKTLAAGILAGALLGGGLAAITPAGAAVQGAAASIDWKLIWQTKIKPRTDKRYYTKKKSNARYYTKWDANAFFESKSAHDASLAGYYTKAQSDLNYYTKAQSDANYYTKAQSDAKYAPYPKVTRGVFHMTMTSGASGESAGADISYGVLLTAAPTAHYILLGDPVPPGCLGTPAAPDALPGNLCVFEAYNFGSLSGAATRGVASITAIGGVANTMGAIVYGFTNGTGNGRAAGSWAMRPGTVVTPTVAPKGPGIDR